MFNLPILGIKPPLHNLMKRAISANVSALSEMIRPGLASRAIQFKNQRQGHGKKRRLAALFR
jgi:hypothetical protein